MAYLVTGGAGYLGSHLVELLSKQFDEEIIVIDNLDNGDFKRLPESCRVVRSSLDEPSLSRLLGKHDQINGLFHLAAKKSVSESIAFPEIYHQTNVLGTVEIIKFCKKMDIPNIVFTSSAAVYGNIDTSNRISELNHCAPGNPYGNTKLRGESLVREFSKESGGQSTCLRVFNMAGASNPLLFDKKGENVIPIILRCLSQDSAFDVFGHDLKTKDGSCVRDFVHVNDVAEAHVLAMRQFAEGKTSIPDILNIASGKGSSVLQLLNLFEELSGVKIKLNLMPLREGDAQIVIGDPSLAEKSIGWTSKRSIDEMIYESWQSWNHTK